MQYLNSEITKVASYLYRHEPENRARFDIYAATEGKSHPKNVIEVEFSEETKAVIDRVGKVLEE